MRFTAAEATAARRRLPLYLVDATDGITPETGETGGQPQISVNGGAWTNTTATLTAVGNGGYYVELTAAELGTAGHIGWRYKSANTAEFQLYADMPTVSDWSANATYDANLQRVLGTVISALISGRLDVSVGAYQTGMTPLQPTTAGRTLDVSTGGEAGVDWANVGSPTTVVGLSGTTVKDATDVNTDTDALLARLTTLRAGYLDNLSAGAVSTAADVTRALGLLHENSYDDNHVYDGNNDLTSLRKRAFASAAAASAATAGAGNGTQSEVARYTLTFTYSAAGKLSSFRWVRDL